MKTLLTLSSIFIGAFFLFLGNSIFLNEINILLKSNNTNDIIIGIINSLYFIGAASSAMSAQKIISRVGYSRSFTFFATSFASTVLVNTLDSNIFILMILKAIQGYSYYGILMIVESWLNEKVESSIRARILGFYETVFLSSFILGIFFVKLPINQTYILIYSVLAITIAILPISLTRIKDPQLVNEQKISVPKIKNVIPLSVVGSFIAGFLINGIMNMGMIYMLNEGFNLTQATYFLACAIAGGLLFQLPIGKLSDSLGRRNAIIVASGIASFCLILNLFISYFPIKLMIGFFLGSGSFCLYSLSLARANDAINKTNKNVVEIGRALLFCYGLGSLVGPFTIGIFMHLLGSNGFNIIFAIMALILFFFALSKQSIPKEERSIYVTIPISGSMQELDPRLDVEEQNKKN